MTITKEKIATMMTGCRAHGICDESKYQAGYLQNQQVVDTLLWAAHAPIARILVVWNPDVDAVMYIAYNDNDAAISALTMRDSVLPCKTAAYMGFVFYCQETRGIPCDLECDSHYSVSLHMGVSRGDSVG